VGGRKTELEDFISMTLVSKYNITSVAVNSISLSFHIEQEKDSSLSRSLWEAITYLLCIDISKPFIYEIFKSTYGETKPNLINSNLRPISL